MKKLFALLLAVTMAFSAMSVAAVAAPGDINVTVGGEAVVFTDAAPYIDANSRTLVPLRAAADAMGLDVQWDGDTKTAVFSGTDVTTGIVTSASFVIGEADVVVDLATRNEDGSLEAVEGGYTVTMDTAAVITNDRTYAPIRYLAETFSYVVDWDAATKTVEIIIPTYEFAYQAVNGSAYLVFYNPVAIKEFTSCTTDIYTIKNGERKELATVEAVPVAISDISEEDLALMLEQTETTDASELFQVFQLPNIEFKSGVQYSADYTLNGINSSENVFSTSGGHDFTFGA